MLPLAVPAWPVRRLYAVAAVLLAFVVAGCWNVAGEPDRDEHGNVVAPADVSVFHLRLGDCTQDSGIGGEVTSVSATACGEPHAYEVFAVGEYTGTDYDVTAIDGFAQTYCASAFEGFVNRPVADSGLELTYLTPTAESFGTGDREVTCLVGTGSEATTGSLRGANR